MSLIINNSSNFYELTGVLNHSNAANLEKALIKGLKRFDKVILSIEEVESIDRYGVEVITKIHETALSSSKSLSIVGYGCKDLYNHFKSSSAA
ncbi:STAS domain-containing protein [Seonamhaeicola marinus]|uniref:STAS domain-containing protein n=1 Tax=Seonamhaeicola marinus TaxID=1912246 RepID=A0A5D0HEZ9_9FLAO|nr:STAS domain-containing protein [Seonamhaeicola marinus]TYA69948.1 hypothetical protein FUA24_21905 [Seonamhaeicola marinus]